MPMVEQFLAGKEGELGPDGAPSRALQQALSCYADAARIVFGNEKDLHADGGKGVPGLQDSSKSILLDKEQSELAAAFVHAMSRIHIDGGTEGSWLEIYADSFLSGMFWGLHMAHVDVPAVILDNPGEVVARVPRRWQRTRFRALVRTTTPAHDGMGNPAGHFFAMERPRLFMEEMIRTLALDASIETARSSLFKDAVARRTKACTVALPYLERVHGVIAEDVGSEEEGGSGTEATRASEEL